jgi:glycosyltransferase involved in cell wall biosynthesis
MDGIQYSVILPIFNEESCLEEVLVRVEKAFAGSYPYEVLCIDDASSDSSWSIIERFHGHNPAFKGIRFKRNFGHQLAVYAGIKFSKGEYVAVLDADGQDPPELVPQMFKKCEEGYDVVYAVRKKRKEGVLKRLGYYFFYRIFRAIVPFKIPLDSGDFSVFSRDVADFIKARSERNPFIRGLRSWHGGKQCGFEYERQERLSGKPKYTYLKLFLLALNASIAFSRVPLRMISIFGMLTALAALLGGVIFIILKLTVGINLSGWTSLTVLIMFFSGVNLLVLGVIGEYIGDIFDEVKDRPPFLVGQTLGVRS